MTTATRSPESDAHRELKERVATEFRNRGFVVRTERAVIVATARSYPRLDVAIESARIGIEVWTKPQAAKSVKTLTRRSVIEQTGWLLFDVTTADGCQSEWIDAIAVLAHQRRLIFEARMMLNESLQYLQGVASFVNQMNAHMEKRITETLALIDKAEGLPA